MQLIESILADAASITALRRDIHAHPELCFQEQRTSDLIAQALTDWGIPVRRGLGGTGVVGIIKNGTSGRALGLRADLDALPVTLTLSTQVSGQSWGQAPRTVVTGVSVVTGASGGQPPKTCVLANHR